LYEFKKITQASNANQLPSSTVKTINRMYAICIYQNGKLKTKKFAEIESLHTVLLALLMCKTGTPVGMLPLPEE
jgi:hypothetical protein